MDIKLKNNVSASIIGNYSTTDTAITVDDGSKFPTIINNEYFYSTIVTMTSVEIVKVVGIIGNVLTVLRSQDDTTAVSIISGDVLQLRLNELAISDYIDEKIEDGNISSILTTPQINDTSSDHQYIVDVSELIADRTITLPLLTGNDEFVFKDHIQTLANKTLTSPILNTGISGTAFLDDDTFATANNTTLASSESIKAYVDSTSNPAKVITVAESGGDFTRIKMRWILLQITILLIDM